MNPTLLLLILPSILIAIACRWRWPHKITWLECGAQALIAIVLVASVWGISTYAATQDVETINGRVTAKSKDWTFCSHSYSCHCRTVSSGSGKHRTTRTVCDTCYEHSNDWNWNVASTVGSFSIDRVDRRGSQEPPRWTAVQSGQPVAMPHGYTNYVKGAPESLFHVIADFKGKLPDYPGFYDYQYSDRVIGAPKDQKLWNALLAQHLIDLGAKKQVNYVVVMTSGPPRFADALRSKWIGGKKNDVIVVIGTKQYPVIDWVRVFSWSKRDIVNVRLRNALMDRKILDPITTNYTIASIIEQEYERRPMKDFEYLKDDVHPSTWVMVFALILGTAASIGAAFYFHGNDIYDEAHSPHRGSRRGSPDPLRSGRVRFRQ